MKFAPTTPILGMTAHAARAGKWQFLILQDGNAWTVSYRLINPKGPVSASSTVKQVFGSFDDARDAAEQKRLELARLQ